MSYRNASASAKTESHFAILCNLVKALIIKSPETVLFLKKTPIELTFRDGGGNVFVHNFRCEISYDESRCEFFGSFRETILAYKPTFYQIGWGSGGTAVKNTFSVRNKAR